jgi:hypothetical protein
MLDHVSEHRVIVHVTTNEPLLALSGILTIRHSPPYSYLWTEITNLQQYIVYARI